MNDLQAIPQIEWARLAMAIDGEGCIAILMKDRKEGRWDWRAFDLVIRVANTDPRLTNWCYRNFGGKVKLAYPKNYRKNHKACFAWEVYGKACGPILKEILPYSIIKKEQIEIALAYVQTLETTYHRHTMPESVKVQRAELFAALRAVRSKTFEVSEPATLS